MDWNICVLCQISRLSGRIYTSTGKSAWICDECVKSEIYQSNNRKRILALSASLLVLFASILLIATSGNKLRDDELLLPFLLSGKYLADVPVRIAGLLHGSGFLAWENLLIIGLILLVLAVVLILYAALRRPSLSKKAYKQQGSKIISRLLIQRKV